VALIFIVDESGFDMSADPETTSSTCGREKE